MTNGAPRSPSRYATVFCALPAMAALALALFLAGCATPEFRSLDAANEAGGEVAELTAPTELETLTGGGRTPVMLVFYSEACPYCRMLLSDLPDIAADYAGRLRVLTVNVKTVPELASRYEIRGVPTTVFLRRGREVDRLVGTRFEFLVRRKINAFLDA